MTAPRERVGIVLGAGGVLGAAWMVGVLSALQARVDRPLGEADIMVGTSAGSVLAAALRTGATVGDLVAHQRGHSSLLPLHEIDRDVALYPPRLRAGSPALITLAVLAPHRVNPRVGLSGLVPRGRGRLTALESFVDSLSGLRREAPLGPHEPPGPAGPAAWPTRPTWIVAVDYRTGRRVVFGRPGAPAASLTDAVIASCSIPGWYEPRQIGERHYVDGGVHSAASVDLLAGTRLDRVYVLAPLASHETDHPTGVARRAERLIRRCVAGWLDLEARQVRATGARVVVVTPGSADLTAMGANLMDARRRDRVLDTALGTSPARLDELDRARGGGASGGA